MNSTPMYVCSYLGTRCTANTGSMTTATWVSCVEWVMHVYTPSGHSVPFVVGDHFHNLGINWSESGNILFEPVCTLENWLASSLSLVVLCFPISAHFDLWWTLFTGFSMCPTTPKTWRFSVTLLGRCQGTPSDVTSSRRTRRWGISSVVKQIHCCMWDNRD